MLSSLHVPRSWDHLVAQSDGSCRLPEKSHTHRQCSNPVSGECFQVDFKLFWFFSLWATCNNVSAAQHREKWGQYMFSLLSSPIISVGIYSMKQLYAWSGVQPKFQLNGEHPYAATSHSWEQKRCLWWNQHQQEELSRRITPIIGYKTCPICPGPKETRLFLDCLCLGVLYFWFCLFLGEEIVCFLLLLLCFLHFWAFFTEYGFFIYFWDSWSKDELKSKDFGT